MRPGLGGDLMPAPQPGEAAVLRAIGIWKAAGRGPFRLVVRKNEVVIEDAPPEPDLARIGERPQPAGPKAWKTE